LADNCKEKRAGKGGDRFEEVLSGEKVEFSRQSGFDVASQYICFQTDKTDSTHALS